MRISGERVSSPEGGFKPTWERHVAAYAAADGLLPPGGTVLEGYAYLGVGTRALSRLAARHTATAKLAMSLLFVGFTIYLFSVSLRIFHGG